METSALSPGSPSMHTLLGTLLLQTASAESFESGGGRGITLHKETVMYVDAVEGEFLVWRGSGGISFTTTTGYGVGWFPNYSYEVADTTTWTLRMSADQTGSWGMEVYSADGTLQSGRVYSDRWIVSSPTTGSGFSESFYVPAPVDTTAASVADGTGQLLKLSLAGLYGDRIEIIANSAGVPGTSPDSGPFDDKTAPPTASLRLYLENPGTLAPGWPATPTDPWTVTYDDPDCGVVFLEEQGVELAFDSPLQGLASIICDLSGDAAYDPTGADQDLLARFEPSPVDVSWYWRGEDLRAEGGGADVEPGSYTCRGGVWVSPVHALIANATVADPGVRWFALDSSSGSSMELFWNDTRLEDGVSLQIGTPAHLQSGAGVYSDSHKTTGEANTNAHGWGNVSTTQSRGSWGWIDTWSSGRFYSYGATEISVMVPDEDADGDSLTSREECNLGTDPRESDSDGGGASDGKEIADGTDPNNPDDDIVPEIIDDSGTAPDTSTPVTDLRGDFSGGALSCSSSGSPRLPPGLALLGMAVLVGWRHRRRER